MIKIKTGDSIIDIINKIINCKEKSIVLEFPFWHLLLHNYLSLKILKNKADRKDLIIVTTDLTSKKIWESLWIKYSIIKNNDFIEQLDDFEQQGDKHKISLRTNKGRKIFFVFRNPLKLVGAGESSVYTFNDITVLEYQKVQIDQYNEYMNELMYTKYKTNEAEGQPDIIDKVKF